MKAKELHQMAEAELKDKLAELGKEIMKYNSQVASGTTPKSPGQLRQAKKAVAKILTEIRQREIKGGTKA
ncbi:MAG: 50S ribosomal protein L29 [Candidatus Woesearchaeota archaeon]